VGYNRWLHYYASFLAFCTLCLIFVGGLVTSTDSGLSVPDWPLSYGRIFPPMVGGVLYEHGHRMVAAAVGFLTVILALWLWKSEPRKWLRRLGFVALATVIAQGVLGGLTVIFRLPVPVSVGHAGLAQVFFCLTVSVAVFTSRRWLEESPRLEDSRAPATRHLAGVTVLVVYVQILLGAVMRHTGSGLAIPDYPLSFGRLVPPDLTPQIVANFAHRTWALVAAFFILWTCLRIFQAWRSEEWLRGAAVTLLGALLVQIMLGAETTWSAREVVPTTLHVAGGAFVLAGSLVLALRAHRIIHPGTAECPTAAVQAGASPE